MVEMCDETVQEPRKKEYFIHKIQNLVDISQNSIQDTITQGNKSSKRKVKFNSEVKVQIFASKPQQNTQLAKKNSSVMQMAFTS